MRGLMAEPPRPAPPPFRPAKSRPIPPPSPEPATVSPGKKRPSLIVRGVQRASRISVNFVSLHSTLGLLSFPLTLFALWAITYGVQLVRGGYYGTLTFESTASYETGLVLRVSGCDISFVPGTERTVTATAQAASRENAVAWDYLDASSESGPVVGLSVGNHLGCAAAPFQRCYHFCHIVIRVPAPETTPYRAPPTIVVYQALLDHSTAQLKATGVTLGSLTIGSSDSPAVTLSVHLTSTIVLSEASIHLYHGSARIVGGEYLSGLDCTSHGPGSVRRHIALPNATGPLSLSYTQPDAALCVLAATREHGAAVEPAGDAPATVTLNLPGNDVEVGSGAPDVLGFGHLGSMGGDVRVSVVQETGAAAPAAHFTPTIAVAPPHNESEHTRPVSGLQLLPWDAARLAARRDELLSGYTVFDVTVSSDVVMPSRWILSPVPIWYVVSPAVLGVLTFSMLKPPSRNERVTFLDHDCTPPASRAASAYNDSLLELHSQLEDLLGISGSNLVLMAPLSETLWLGYFDYFVGSPMVYYFGVDAYFAIKSRELFRPDDTPAGRRLHIAMAMAIFIACIASAMACRALYHVLLILQTQAWDDELARRNMMLEGVHARNDGDKKRLDGWRAQGGVTKRLEDFQTKHQPARWPFENPFTNLHTLVVDIAMSRIKRKCINSVSIFVGEAFRAGNTKGEKSSVALETAHQRYLAFCLEQELQPHPSSATPSGFAELLASMYHSTITHGKEEGNSPDHAELRLYGVRYSDDYQKITETAKRLSIAANKANASTVGPEQSTSLAKLDDELDFMMQYHATRRVRLSAQTLLLHGLYVLEVALQLLLMLGPSLALGYYILEMQQEWQLVLAPTQKRDVETAIDTEMIHRDVMGILRLLAYPPGGSGTMVGLLPLVYFVIMWQVVFGALAVVRLFFAHGAHLPFVALVQCILSPVMSAMGCLRCIKSQARVEPNTEQSVSKTRVSCLHSCRAQDNKGSYANVPGGVLKRKRKPLASTERRKVWGLPDLFGLLVLIHTFALVALLFLSCEWMILAAVLDPAKYLPYGVSVISGAFVVRQSLVSLRDLSSTVRQEIRDTFALSSSNELVGAVEQLRIDVIKASWADKGKVEETAKRSSRRWSQVATARRLSSQVARRLSSPSAAAQDQAPSWSPPGEEEEMNQTSDDARAAPVVTDEDKPTVTREIRAARWKLMEDTEISEDETYADAAEIDIRAFKALGERLDLEGDIEMTGEELLQITDAGNEHGLFSKGGTCDAAEALHEFFLMGKPTVRIQSLSSTLKSHVLVRVDPREMIEKLQEDIQAAIAEGEDDSVNEPEVFFRYLDLKLLASAPKDVKHEYMGHRGKLTQTEFQMLFKSMPDLKVHAVQVDKLFLKISEYDDEQKARLVDKANFVEQWHCVEDVVVEERLGEVGLSTRDVLAIVGALACTLVLFFAFILTAIAAWSEGSAFESVTQSGFVAGTGAAIGSAGSGDYDEDLESMRENGAQARDKAAQQNMKVGARHNNNLPGQARAGGGPQAGMRASGGACGAMGQMASAGNLRRVSSQMNF